MKILYYKKNNNLFPGIYTEKGIIDIALYNNEFNNRPLNLQDMDSLKIIEQKGLQQPHLMMNEEALTIGTCVPNPQKIICIGLNYRKHAMEAGMAIPAVPIVFSKFNNTLIDYEKGVPLGNTGAQFDYEVELGVVIGKQCKNILKQEAHDYVFGYCVANDMSCRDLQFLSSQWLLGKSLDYFLPLGKFLLTADEIKDPQNLQLTCTLNGEPRQNSNTSDMIFSVAEIITFLSKHMTLLPGDLIVTGTPEGVIMGMSEKHWLKPGDIVKVEISGLGSSTNKMW